jgi:hypothetical protein
MTEMDDVHVDATRPFLLLPDGASVLFPSTRQGTWFHADLAARTSRVDERYLFSVLRTRHSASAPGDPPVTTGGVLTAQVELIGIAADADRSAILSDHLEQTGALPAPDGRYVLLPLLLRQGRMAVRGPAGHVTDQEGALDVGVGSAASATVLVALTPDGADALHAAVTGGSGPPLEVGFAHHYDTFVPPCRYRVVAGTAAVYGVLAQQLDAVAGIFGPSGGADDLDVLMAELRSTQAVDVEWQARPAGFGAARLATMEEAILQRWLGTAAELLGARIVPGSEPIEITLADLADVGDADLTHTHDGKSFGTAPFRRSADLSRLRGLTDDGYAADVRTDAASLPIVLAFGREDRVQQFLCHVGYRTADGRTTVTTHDATGPEGLTIDDRMRWGPGQAPPDHVDVRYSITWVDTEWESLEEAVRLPTDGPCVALSVNPGAEIAEVTIVADLATADVGALAVVSWMTDLPEIDGRKPKDYSGSFAIEGRGPEGAPERRTVSFPCPRWAAAATGFSWTADVALPSGVLLSGSGTFTLAEATEAVITMAALQHP